MANPVEDVNRVVRTVIEAADPALRPVVRLRRFVVKRVELLGSAPAGANGSQPARSPARGRPAPKPTSAEKPRK